MTLEITLFCPPVGFNPWGRAEFSDGRVYTFHQNAVRESFFVSRLGSPDPIRAPLRAKLIRKALKNESC